MFELMTRYFWAVAIVVTGIHAARIKARSTQHIRQNPELAHGYATLIRGYLISMNIPWVVMGIGCMIGGVPTVMHYFRPQDGDPYVLAWFASMLLLSIAGTYWLLLGDGAEMLVKHPGVFNRDVSSPTMVKLLWCACLAAGIFGVIMMWMEDMPLPRTH